ncbi:MAG: putative cytosolic protein [Myxococcaceae bacterium]|nr:putative cytosolic protein [Myxococcaceae bacterium]
MASAEPMNERKARVEVFPRIITVSREFGAGGARISLRIAAELGYQLWDQELSAYLARKADADPAALREIDERERPLLDEVLATSLYGRISCSKFRTLLTRTVAELAGRGGAVIVGRGANFLVDSEHALRVRIVCPIKQRIERYASAALCDWPTAERFVLAKDRERERFARQLCGEQTADPTHYDLIVNTHDLSEEASTRLIIAAYRARFGGPTRPVRDDVTTALTL